MNATEVLDTIDTAILVIDSALDADGRMDPEELLSLRDELTDAQQRLEFLGDENEDLRADNTDITQLRAIVDTIRATFTIPDDIPNGDIPELLADIFAITMGGVEEEEEEEILV